MRIQTLTGIFPTERPPDPENGSPGAVGTVAGAEVQSPEIVAHASPTTPVRPAAPLRIVIEPTASGRKWTARLGDRVLCTSAWPFVRSARLLLDEGHPADALIEMWRPTPMNGQCEAASVLPPQRSSTGRQARPAPRTGHRLAITSEVAKEACRRRALVLRPFLGADDDARKRSSTPKFASPAADRR